MYAMKVVASSVLGMMSFPHNGKVFIIDQLTTILSLNIILIMVYPLWMEIKPFPLFLMFSLDYLETLHCLECTMVLHMYLPLQGHPIFIWYQQ
jgi:hypothetical protein